jgi:hypothetical protein
MMFHIHRPLTDASQRLLRGRFQSASNRENPTRLITPYYGRAALELVAMELLVVALYLTWARPADLDRKK